ncbi:ABC transporter permease [Thermodesulfobacteriota bacterium]
MLRLDDLLRVSIRQVFRQRRRNIGVVLAVALGTAGLIIVITMGRDVKQNFNEDLELLGGATRLMVSFEGQSMIQRFKESTRDALRRLPGVKNTTLMVAKRKDAVSSIGDQKETFKLVGVDEYFWDVSSFSPESGVFFGHEDVIGRKRVCVIGENLAKKIFGHLKVAGLMLPIDNDFYKIVGVLGSVAGSDWSKWAFIPITTAQDRIEGVSLPRWMYVRCHTWDDVAAVSKKVPGVIKANQEAPGLRVEVAWGPLKRVKAMALGIEIFVNLAVVSTLVLGGFGIWNVTMAGVSARTREIGLKKAMGAEDMDILAQFLTEALCLSLGAAIIGIILGRVGVEVLASMLDSRPSEDLFLTCVFLGLVFSVILGIGAGLVPSIKASRMEVVSAVRFE